MFEVAAIIILIFFAFVILIMIGRLNAKIDSEVKSISYDVKMHRDDFWELKHKVWELEEALRILGLERSPAQKAKWVKKQQRKA